MFFFLSCSQSVSGETEVQEAREGVSRPCPLSCNVPPSPSTERDVTLRRTQGQSSLENVTFRSCCTYALLLCEIATA